MCGSIRLNSGECISPNALIHRVFPHVVPQGFIRKEKINTTWKDRVKFKARIPISGVYENNTRGFTLNGVKPPGVWFKFDPKTSIEILVVRGFTGALEGRIVTIDAKKAKGKFDPSRVHHRFLRTVRD